MKKTVLIVIIISAIIFSGVLFAGFLNNQQNDSSQPAQIQKTQQQQTRQKATDSYSSAEVSTHNTPEDCWIIIENNVYDVTDFLSQHPGGGGLITPYCGEDATQAFATQGGEGTHSSTAIQLREDYFKLAA